VIAELCGAVRKSVMEGMAVKAAESGYDEKSVAWKGFRTTNKMWIADL
jgi:hypothetical protein